MDKKNESTQTRAVLKMVDMMMAFDKHITKTEEPPFMMRRAPKPKGVDNAANYS